MKNSCKDYSFPRPLIKKYIIRILSLEILKGGLGVSGALAGFGTFLTTEMGAGLALSALSSPPVAVTLATVGTVAVGTGAAGLSGKIVEKVFNSRAKSRKWWHHFNP